jgi:sugar lactone lactonase YvrE
VARVYESGGVWYIRTYAGTPGVQGDSGDGGRATAAQLNDVVGLGIDEAGVLYIADYGTNRIRRVLPDGRIEAFAGNGVNTRYEGDGGDPLVAGLLHPIAVAVDPRSGAVFITDQDHNVIRVVRDEGGARGLVIRTAAGTGACEFEGDEGPATSASLCYPFGLAMDGHGGLYIADTSNNRIRHASFEAAR